jgi:hypothetical protein
MLLVTGKVVKCKVVSNVLEPIITFHVVCSKLLIADGYTVFNDAVI